MQSYVYKIINKTNGKFYIGVRSFDGTPLDDTYMGSGKVIKLAIKKYGKDNFIKEILYSFDNRIDAENLERDLISLYLNDNNCYNIAAGGTGGYTGPIWNKGIPVPEEQKEIQRAKIKKWHEINPQHAYNFKSWVNDNMDVLKDIHSKRKGIPLSESHIINAANGHKGLKYNISEEGKQKRLNTHIGNTWNLGKTRSEETKLKQSAKLKGLKTTYYTNGTTLKMKRFKQDATPLWIVFEGKIMNMLGENT